MHTAKQLFTFSSISGRSWWSAHPLTLWRFYWILLDLSETAPKTMEAAAVTFAAYLTESWTLPDVWWVISPLYWKLPYISYSNRTWPFPSGNQIQSTLLYTVGACPFMIDKIWEHGTECFYIQHSTDPSLGGFDLMPTYTASSLLVHILMLYDYLVVVISV